MADAPLWSPYPAFDRGGDWVQIFDREGAPVVRLVGVPAWVFDRLERGERDPFDGPENGFDAAVEGVANT